MDFGTTGLGVGARPAPADSPDAAPAPARSRPAGSAEPIDAADALRAAVADPTLLDRFEAE